MIHWCHKKQVSAIAFIGASTPDAKTVTTCFVEVLYLNSSNDPEGSSGPEVILWVAQNKGVDEAELAKLQSLVDGFMWEINM